MTIHSSHLRLACNFQSLHNPALTLIQHNKMFNFRDLADVSKRAKARETEAKETFTAAKAAFEETDDFDDFEFGQTHIIQPLLLPKCHLTSVTWGTFSKWVENEHPGWKAKRREATSDEDKKGHTARGKCYFVDVAYQGESIENQRLIDLEMLCNATWSNDIHQCSRENYFCFFRHIGSKV